MKNVLSLGLLIIVVSTVSTTGAVGQSLFWVDADFLSPKIGRSDLTGGGVVTVPLVSRSLPEGLALDADHNKVYLADLAFTHANIRGASTNLSAISSIDSSGSVNRGIALDPVGGKIYWTTSNLVSGAKILKANLDGSGKQILYTFSPGAGANLRGIALKDSILYWADFTLGKIQSGSTSGSAVPTDVITGLNGPVGVAIGKDGYIYWTEANANVIKRRTLVPGPVSTMVSGLSAPQYVAVDGASSQMFWTEIGIPRIRKANLNGSNVQTLAISVAHPTGIATSTSTTNVKGAGQAPLVFALNHNYPNPFNPSTTIGYAIAGTGREVLGTRWVRLAVYDLLGREVAVLVDQPQEPGEYSVTWNAAGMSSGMYFYRLRTEAYSETRGMILTR